MASVAKTPPAPPAVPACTRLYCRSVPLIFVPVPRFLPPALFFVPWARPRVDPLTQLGTVSSLMQVKKSLMQKLADVVKGGDKGVRRCSVPAAVAPPAGALGGACPAPCAVPCRLRP